MDYLPCRRTVAMVTGEYFLPKRKVPTWALPMNPRSIAVRAALSETFEAQIL